MIFVNILQSYIFNKLFDIYVTFVATLWCYVSTKLI